MDLPKSESALLVVDVQNDFCPGGRLAVPSAEETFPVINRLIQMFGEAECPIVFTQDYHPANHCSFVPQGGPWPMHCVQGTSGVDIHPVIDVPPTSLRFAKGFSPVQDAYSGFEGRLLGADGSPGSMELASWLRQHGVKTVFVAGLATDYCVQATAMDALHLGFATKVVENGVRGVNRSPDDSQKALHRLQGQGARLLRI